jgi:transposase InsO family protein
MIHDHAAQFNLNYIAYGIKGIKTSVKAPNMNALAERFIGSVRREALDYYLLISEKQIMRILQEYIDYYNSKRLHQVIDQRVPMGYKPQLHGRVQKFPILDGLCNHYVRSAA